MHPNMKLMVRWLDSVFSQWISSTIFSIILLKVLLNFLNIFTFLIYFFCDISIFLIFLSLTFFKNHLILVILTSI